MLMRIDGCIHTPFDGVFDNIGYSNVLVLDVDATLRCGKGRLHLIPTEEERLKAYQDGNANEAWTKFNNASDTDTPLWGNIRLANLFYSDNFVMMLTSCTYSEKSASILMHQLREWDIKVDVVFMRHPDNHLEPVTMKECFIKGLTEIVEPDKITCIDDCEKNLTMFKSHGCTAVKVYYD